uniref:HPt domain-containing protein n=1 Tax=Proboscia inermis TaxID=420281 RepID=A0A7S0GHA3_9STRA|mmetsp:Transcript_64770/g.76040  ORF Transcript_64770/g.76040 Transcript_64770/m.76040 type:complete len:123 (-) Transcript_64770:468-836(-)|eukprot:CAMPEP_0171322206 /NCGR_PEP_ID=MMETSP0816-20121228/114814_1 /TAXON_ID=420281 /ORGANISM="Proboscia inermis, Strain CCAP1064/1" /LENGTH=122 /DNA_ID=CAMNT_0011820623 /DNA_START=563 /DNA_END=931 /DNA_ORIENTATION=-
MASADGAGVIDWDEAMEQCGGDEEFLEELLVDLKEEVGGQIEKMENALSEKGDGYQLKVQRASHVIKGASSNLFCEALRDTSTTLEQDAAKGKSDEILVEGFNQLKVAVTAYYAYLEANGWS